MRGKDFRLVPAALGILLGLAFGRDLSVLGPMEAWAFDLVRDATVSGIVTGKSKASGKERIRTSFARSLSLSHVFNGHFMD